MKTFTAFTIEVGWFFSLARSRDKLKSSVSSAKNNSGMDEQSEETGLYIEVNPFRVIKVRPCLLSPPPPSSFPLPLHPPPSPFPLLTPLFCVLELRACQASKSTFGDLPATSLGLLWLRKHGRIPD